MTTAKTITIILLGAFSALLIWATMGGFSELDVLYKNPWAMAATADLIFGLVMMSILIAFNETSATKAAAWIAALFLLGNPATAVYFLVNLPKLRAKLAE